MSAWFKASRAMLLSVALGVLVGLLVPGVNSLGRSIGGNDSETATEAGAIGVLEGPATPKPEADETEAPEDTPRPRTNTNSGTTTQATPAPTDDGTVVIIATPHPSDDSDVNEGDSHSSGSLVIR